MTKQEIVQSFARLFQDYLYSSGKPLTKNNVNTWLKKEQWDKVYQVVDIYAIENMEVKFKYKEMGSSSGWKNYQANWMLKV